uniref:Pyrokinin-1 n=2 Tax=Carausius morosus TaxID=7022 RepID=PPK1_CARMO|nr:RecName: Full=Pyrokinin-1; Short=Cam-PK-1; AltName: Full=FXPRL-Amide [Carausius morosus]
DEGGTQYTPRL